jgi:hypothetical protein
LLKFLTIAAHKWLKYLTKAQKWRYNLYLAKNGAVAARLDAAHQRHLPAHSSRTQLTDI